MSGFGFIFEAVDADEYRRLATTRGWFSEISFPLWVAGRMTFLSALALAAAVLLAGAHLEAAWRKKRPSRLSIWWSLWRPFFSGPLRGKLERNPVRWLHERTASCRLVVWGWTGALCIAIGAVLFLHIFGLSDISGIELTVALLLAGNMALSSAGSFRRERETGVLELLLVSPLPEGRILWGRLVGLWMQFLPAFGLLLVSWLCFSTFIENSACEAVPFFGGAFLTLPIIGLFFSLRCRSFIAACLWTLGTGLVLPVSVLISLDRVALFRLDGYSSQSWDIRFLNPATFTLAFLAAGSWLALRNGLKSRAFCLDRTEA
jgi:hypothetical protein